MRFLNIYGSIINDVTHGGGGTKGDSYFYNIFCEFVMKNKNSSCRRGEGGGEYQKAYICVTLFSKAEAYFFFGKFFDKKPLGLFLRLPSRASYLILSTFAN